jgi:hypothetical protein
MIGSMAERTRRALAIGAVVVAVLGVLELTTRALADHLPEPLVFHSYEAQRKVEQMDAIGDVDVVFLGTSMANDAAVPSVFSEAAGGDVTAYNASLSSGIPQFMEPWALQVVLPRLHPKLVVIGLSSGDLTDAGEARTVFFDAFRDSPAGRELLDRESILDRTDRFLREHLALWAHRAELRDPDAVFAAIRGEKPEEDPVTASIDADGHPSFGQDQRFEDRPPQAGIAGVSVWSPGTRDAAALRRLVAGVEAEGGRVVFVEMPVTEEYIARHPRGNEDYLQFEQMLSRLAADLGVPLLDLDQDRDHSLFSDELHLNTVGAERFSVALAHDLSAAGLLPS